MYLYHIKDKELVSRNQLVDRITLYIEERIRNRAGHDSQSIDKLAKKQSKFLRHRIHAGSAYAILSHRRYDVVRENHVALDDAPSEGPQRKGSYFDVDTTSDGEEQDDKDTDDGDSSDDDVNQDTDDGAPPKKKMTISEKLTPHVLKRLVKITSRDVDPSSFARY
ncbi:hypothetical protein EYR38_000010 [Pleurotus pulmonarius]|nr:hypothetical protein EYR38_000010 [Pleurotus pulmonarius]